MGSNLDKLIDAVEAGEATKHQFLTWRPGLSGTRKESAMMFKAYNGSLDAAKALHEALLPGWDWSAHGNGQACLWPPGSIDEQNSGCIETDIEDEPSRAMLLAILKAYRAQQVTA